MKASETVIKGAVRQTLEINWSNSITGHLLGWQVTLEPNAQDKVDAWIKGIRLEQAEITWSIAEKEGMKEVVDYVLAHRETEMNKYGNIYIKPDEWRAKLKEWGIEQ